MSVPTSDAAQSPLQARLAANWMRLAPRERLALSLAFWVLGAGLLWWLALQPPLRTLRDADTQRVALDRQLQTMLNLQSEAKALQAQPRLATADAQRALELAVKQKLGAQAQVNTVGERATVTLKAVNGEALAQWLSQVRANAHALPIEARLVRTPPGGTGPTAGAITWDGTVVLRLP